MIPKKNFFIKEKYVWDWFNYMLSQRSILSMIISFILINLLMNISIYIWSCVFPKDFLIVIIVIHILQPLPVQHLIEYCPRFAKKFERRFVYVSGYIFVWIFLIIRYIFFDIWQLIFDKKVFLSHYFSSKISLK